jgi:Tol biopolymer transport system component
MSKLISSATLLVLLVLMGITMDGCSSTRAFVPVPTPGPGPTPQPAKAPFGAFIEEVAAFSTNRRNMYVATNDGTGLTKVNAQLTDFNSVYVLSDGSKGVYAAQPIDNGYSQIYYLSALDGSTQPQQLTSTPVHKTSAMLSADGSKIVFLQLNPLQNDPDSHLIWDVAVMDTNGSNLYVIPRPEGWYVSHPFFSPDGGTIVVALDQGAFGDMGIFIMNADGSALRRLSPGGANGILAVAPAFSPDGKQVVFSSVGWNDVSIYIINTDGSGLQHIGQPNSGGGAPYLLATVSCSSLTGRFTA